MASDLVAHRDCLVTGSSRGIGLGAARALAAHGANVTLHGRDEEALRLALAGLHPPGRHQYMAADLAERGGVERLTEETCRRLARLDVLIHSAGSLGPRFPLA